ncbi:MAG: low molecular weight phosphatase family protein [Tepidisphaeraceae bacterium]|jgi:protein-tyrosine phosphatase
MSRPNTILFLCTGNYYRSRFAEVYFNELTSRAGLDWSADSRALKISAGRNVGPMSVAAIKRLRGQGIHLQPDIRFPQPLHEADLQSASLIIGLKEAEHRPMLEKMFPRRTQAVEFWHVHDVDQATAEESLGEIEGHVEQLIKRLQLPEASGDNP